MKTTEKTNKRAVVALIELNGEVVMCKRKEADYFGLPGGKVEDGETPYAAIKREVHEETPYTIEPGEIVATYTDVDGYDVDIFFPTVLNNPLRASFELENKKVPMDEYPSLCGRFAQHNQEHLDMYKKFNKIIMPGRYYNVPLTKEVVYVISEITDSLHNRCVHPLVLVSSTYDLRPRVVRADGLESLGVEMTHQPSWFISMAWVEDVEKNPTKYSMTDRARLHAIRCHNATGQEYDGMPYSYHLAKVAKEVRDHAGLIVKPGDPNAAQIIDVIEAGAWEHDSQEDAMQTFNDVKKATCEEVAELSLAVTNGPGRNRSERADDSYYSRIRGRFGAAYLKLCDRLANSKNGGDMAAKYLKEYDSFRSRLDGGEYPEMWKELADVVGYELIKEHDVVEATRDFDLISAGDEGTVVHVYDNGPVVVEFATGTVNVFRNQITLKKVTA